MDIRTFNKLLNGFCQDPTDEGWDIIADFLKEFDEVELVGHWVNKGVEKWGGLKETIWKNGTEFLSFQIEESPHLGNFQPKYELFLLLLNKALGCERKMEWTYAQGKVRWKVWGYDVDKASKKAYDLMPILDYLTQTTRQCVFSFPNNGFAARIGERDG